MATTIDIKDILHVDKDTEITLGMIREKIAELRQELLNLDSTSDEYKDTAREVNILQKEMGDVMNASKKYTVDAAGSFNALTAELRQLKEQWKATADSDARKKLTTEINLVKAQLNDMNHDIGNYQDNVGNYTNSIVDAFTKMGISATSLTAPLKKVGVDIEGMDTSLKILIGSVKMFSGQNLSAMKAGFTAVTTSAKGFIASLNGIQAAILATGIGALVVAIGALIANWDEWIGKTQAETNALNDLNNKIMDLDDDINHFNVKLDYFVELKRLEGASDKEIIEYQQKMIGQEYELVQWKLQQAQANWEIVEGEKEIQKLNEYNNALLKEMQNLSNRKYKLGYDALLADAKATKKAEEEKAAAAKRGAAAASAAAKKSAEERQKYIDDLVQKEVEATNRIIDEEFKRLQTALDAQTELEQESWNATERENFEYNKRKKLFKEYHLDTEALERVHQRNLAEIQNTATQERLDNEYRLEERRRALSKGVTVEGGTGIAAAEQAEKEAQEDYDRFKKYSDAKIEANLEQMSKLEEGSEEWTKLYIENSELRIEQANKEAEVKNRNKDKEDKILKARQQAYKNMASGTADILKNMSTALGENTKLGKGFAIAAATIDTIAAAVAGFRAGMNQWADAGPLAYMAPIQAALNAAVALTAGFAQVQKIASVDTSGNATASGGSATALAIPNIEGLTSPVEYTRQVTTETEQEQMNQDNRVYILESDIQASNNRVKVREEETTF